MVIDNTKKIRATAEDGTPFVVDTDAYTAGDVVGGLLVLPLPPTAGLGGRITDIYLTDAVNQSEPYTIYIYDDEPTDIADDAAWEASQAIADLDKLLKIQSLAAGDYTTINSLGFAHIPDLAIDFDTPDSRRLFVYLVPTATPAYTDETDLKLFFMCLLN